MSRNTCGSSFGQWHQQGGCALQYVPARSRLLPFHHKPSSRSKQFDDCPQTSHTDFKAFTSKVEQIVHFPFFGWNGQACISLTPTTSKAATWTCCGLHSQGRLVGTPARGKSSLMTSRFGRPKPGLLKAGCGVQVWRARRFKDLANRDLMVCLSTPQTAAASSTGVHLMQSSLSLQSCLSREVCSVPHPVISFLAVLGNSQAWVLPLDWAHALIPWGARKHVCLR